MRRFPPEVIGKVIKLRKSGRSLSEISRITGVSKNTVYHWVIGIELTPLQKARLHKKEITCGKKGLRKAHKIKRAKKLKWKKGLISRVKQYGEMVNKKSAFAKLICGVLYLCEGAKYPSSKQMIFGSTDPRLIKTFLCLLRNNFVIDEKKIRCRIMHRYDQDGEQLNKYWAHITQIPLRQFYKNYRDKRTKGLVTKKPGYKGICAVQYNSVDLQYELQLIGESLYLIKD
ncbi:MAG: helix-turn-helix domain-containing protein [Candidatus Omnitrophica bacterium]|nr:helix-turn-helix domain-containing protein [Candidatus Omnitrophota bacterium]